MANLTGQAELIGMFGNKVDDHQTNTKYSLTKDFAMFKNLWESIFPTTSDAYKEGNQAYYDGKSIDSCPYGPDDCLLHTEWIKGYHGD